MPNQYEVQILGAAKLINKHRGRSLYRSKLNRAAIITITSAALFALAGCSNLQNVLNNFTSNDTAQENTSPSTSLVMNYDPNLIGSGNPCSDSFCQFFSVEITNNGTTPVDFFDDICLVADGITYAENFGVMLSGTLNPGSTSGFDAAFRPASGANVTELYVGSCTIGTKLASLKLNYTS